MENSKFKKKLGAKYLFDHYLPSANIHGNGLSSDSDSPKPTCFQTFVILLYLPSRVEFIQLALDYKPVNLGQGFPDFAAPPHVSKALSDAATGPNVLLNQYTRGFVSS